ncbi:hypothetical protein [Spirillospora sp. CA-294931]|uniref:hypothetical protein n=1 Tax=Spirillospora sp. CA-294931 TaxID=3240042 RepID=UPI003D8FA7A4
MPDDPEDRDQRCSASDCDRCCYFHLGLESPGPAGRQFISQIESSCGMHLLDVVQLLMREKTMTARDSAQVVVYVTAPGQRTDETAFMDPFNRLPIGLIMNPAGDER